MKNKKSLSTVLGCAMLALSLTACVSNKQAEMQSRAKITKADAEKTALARVPDGAIKEAELEDENGKLIWSFDLATPGSKDTTEVNVDAITGEIADVSKESPESEKKEKD
jgi:uncharacterized membrane protein YkoI